MADEQKKLQQEEMSAEEILANARELAALDSEFMQELKKRDPARYRRVADKRLRRKREIDIAMQTIEQLQKLENGRLKNAELSRKSAQAALTAAYQSGDETMIAQAQANVDAATKATLPDPNLSKQLSVLQNHALNLMSGADQPRAENSVTLGGRSYTPDEMAFLRDNPDQLQEMVRELQEEAEAGNTQSQQDAEALATHFEELLAEQGFRMIEDQGFLPQAQEFVQERIVQPTQRLIENIQNRMFGLQGDQTLTASPAGPTAAPKAVEATRRQSISEIQRAKTIRIRGTQVETE
jgi:hypothetical protein